MTKKKIIDIDAEFDGVEFDEKSINKATGIKNRSQNLTWRKNLSNAVTKIFKDNPERAVKQSLATKQKLLDPEHQKKRKEAQEKNNQNTELRAKRIKHNKAMASDSELVKKRNKATSEKNSKCIVTKFGIFPSKIAAIKFATENKSTSRTTLQSNRVYISQCLKSDPENYYYISKEEYTKLTGKTI